MLAQSQRFNVSASNMANAESVTGADGQPYQAKHVIFQSNSEGIGGVHVSEVGEIHSAGKLLYEPGNPLADDQGYVRMPDIDVVGEMVNTISASRSYQANVDVMSTAKSLMLKTLTLGQ